MAGSRGTRRSGERGRLRFHLPRASDHSLWWCRLREDLAAVARAQLEDNVDGAMPVGGCTGGGMGLP